MPHNITTIYPGTFDPVTVGHLDIIRRGASKFGRVIVGLIEVPQRKSPLFTPDEREAFLREALCGHDNIVVDRFNELVVEFARKWDAHVILKGLRAISDFEYEFAMAQLNRKLAPDIETVFMMASPEHSFLSSGDAIMNTVSMSGANFLLSWAMANSYSKSEMARNPLRITCASHLRANSTTSSLNRSTTMLSWPQSASLRNASRSSGVNSGDLRCGTSIKPTMTRPNLLAPRLMMSRWPTVTGSKVPG